jgi:hypothetical protein
MPRIYSIPLRNAQRAAELCQLAADDFRSVQQQAAYLLDQAIAEAVKARGLFLDGTEEEPGDEVGEVLYASAP